MAVAENQSTTKQLILGVIIGVTSTAVVGASATLFNAVTDGSLVNLLGGVTDTELRAALENRGTIEAPSVDQIANELATNYQDKLRGPKGEAGPAGSPGVSSESVSKDEVREIVRQALSRAISEQSDLIEEKIAEATQRSEFEVSSVQIKKMIAFDPRSVAGALHSAGVWETPGPIEFSSESAALYFAFSEKFVQQKVALTVYYDFLDDTDCYQNLSYASFDPDGGALSYRMLRGEKPLVSEFGRRECGFHNKNWRPYSVISRDNDGSLSGATFVFDYYNVSTNLLVSNRFKK